MTSTDYGTLEDSETPAKDDADFVENHLRRICRSRIGLYQLLFALTVQYAALFGCFNYTMMSWGGLTPNVECYSQNNLTEYCDVVEKCDNYSTDVVFHSLVNEWNLTTCFDKIGDTFDVRRFLTSMQAIGFTVGGIISGPIADRYGRKWIVFLGNLVMIGFGLGSAFAPNWHVLAGVLFMMSLCRSLTVMPQTVQGIESTTSTYRLVITVAGQWELAYVLSAALAYGTRDWSKFILYSNIVCIPMVLLMFFSVESPRWLIERGKYKQAASALNMIAKINFSNARITESELADIYQDRTTENLNLPVIDLLKSIFDHLRSIITTPNLLIVMLLTIVVRGTESIIDVSFQFNLNDFITSPFVSIGAYGLMRIWCPILAIALDVKFKWFSRRIYALSSLSLMVLFNLGAVISAILMKSENSTPHLTMTIFFILADVINNGLLYSAITQIVAEHFPTNMRNTALSILSIAAGLGEVFGNLVLELQPFWHPAPYVLVEGLLICGLAASVFLLPETKDKVLQDRASNVAR